MKALVAWLAMTTGLALVAFSDLFIRTQDIPGTNPESYDIYGSFITGIFGFALITLLLRKD